MDEINRLTIADFELLELGNRLKQIDEDYRQHLQAFLNVVAKGQKKSGKPVYSKFEKFYNYKREQEKVLNKENDQYASLKNYLKGEQK